MTEGKPKELQRQLAQGGEEETEVQSVRELAGALTVPGKSLEVLFQCLSYHFASHSFLLTSLARKN